MEQEALDKWLSSNIGGGQSHGVPCPGLSKDREAKNTAPVMKAS